MNLRNIHIPFTKANQATLPGAIEKLSSNVPVPIPSAIPEPNIVPTATLPIPPQKWYWTNPDTKVTQEFSDAAFATKAADDFISAKAKAAADIAKAAATPTPEIYATESNLTTVVSSVPLTPAVAPVAAEPIKETIVSTAAPVPAPKVTLGQDIGNFFHKLVAGLDKGFAFVEKIDTEAQPIITAIDAGIAPLDPPLAAAIAAGDGLVNGILSVTGSVLNTINTVGATNATVEQKMAAALPAIEQEILSDPTLAGAVKAVGGTPTKIAQFNSSLTAAAQALYLLTTAI